MPPMAMRRTFASVSPAGAGLAQGHLARRNPRQAVLALRRRAGAPGASRHATLRALAGRVAADRVAGGGCRAGQVLVLQPAAAHFTQASGQGGQDALVDRAGLPGAEAGTWPWPLRGPQ